VRKRKAIRHAGPFTPGAEIELEITTLTNMGQGLGRVVLEDHPAAVVPTPAVDETAAPTPDADDVPEQESESVATTTGPRGWVVLVPFALPGELVRVRVWRNQRNFSDADLVAVVRPSPHRLEPPCPLFGRCGGCQYQNFEYTEQLAWKRRQVEELLRHMARVEFPVRPVIASPREYGYRSKITPHFERPRPDRPLEIGFLRAGSRFSVLDLERCALATDAINERLVLERARIREAVSAGRIRNGATILLRESADGVCTDPAAIIRERVEGVDLRFPAGEFFQNNPFILEDFTRHVRERAAADGARFLVDAYCGSGLFGLTAARAFEHVVGIEINEASVQSARANAAANGIDNVSFVAGDASAIFAQVAYPPHETAVVIDPPRKGSDEAFLAQLVAFAPRTIVYVSCNPSTQMRDLPTLLAAGWSIREVQPFDLFPQTKHLECVVTLGRDDAAAPTA
jgi:23S rRNA (uracil1939-C5)-methyltransferase/tRNA (uracil-5-)-methyltransferase